MNPKRDIPRLGPPLPSHLLARRDALPRKPDAVTLRGERLLVRPYSASDGDELHAISNGDPVSRLGKTTGTYDADALVWRYLPAGPFASAAQLVGFHDWIDSLADACPLVVVDAETGLLLGSASLLACDPTHLKIEIGNVWYSPAVQGAGVNAEVTNLLVRHVVNLGFQRVEWKCHVDNHRSRRAAMELGFKFEGVQEAHYIVKDRRRDTAWYRLLATEIPENNGE